MGKTKGPYQAEFPKGSKVKIADRAFLENFLNTWKFHHKLEPQQLGFADKIATVKALGFITVATNSTNSTGCRATGTNSV
jgi:hypothetical protein